MRNNRYKKVLTHKLLKFRDPDTYFFNFLDSMETLLQNDDFIAVLIENIEKECFEYYVGWIEKLWLTWDNGRKDIVYTID